MVAALFNDSEIAALIATKKYREHESAARDKTKGRDGDCSISKMWSDEYPDVIFFMQQQVKHPEAHFTLLVQMNDGRPQTAICRYEIQMGAHIDENGTILPMVPHRHIYAAETFRQYGVWDRMAEPLQLRNRSVSDLLGRFITDLNIHYSDTDTHFFDFVNARPT